MTTTITTADLYADLSEAEFQSIAKSTDPVAHTWAWKSAHRALQAVLNEGHDMDRGALARATVAFLILNGTSKDMAIEAAVRAKPPMGRVLNDYMDQIDRIKETLS